MIGRFLIVLFFISILSSGVFHYALASAVIFSDGFEEDFSNWTGDDVKWTTSGTSSATGVHGGLRRAQVTGATDPGDDVLLKNVSTADYQGIKLEFWYRIYKGLEDEDHIYIEWTGDGSAWNILKDFTAVGDSTSWEFVSYNLPAEADNKDNFAFRFRAHLGAASSDIFYLDDIVLYGDGQNIQATLTPSPSPVPSPTSSPTVLVSPTPLPSIKPTPSPLPVGEATPTPLPSPVKLSVSSTPAPTIIKTKITSSTAPAPTVKENAEEEFQEEPAGAGSLSASLVNLMGSNSFLLMGLMVVAVVFSLAKFKKD